MAILRAEAEVTLSHPARSEQEYRSALEVMSHTTERLARIVEDLFLLARADGGQRMLEPRDVYLDELPLHVVRAMAPVAAQRDVRIAFGSPPTTDEGTTCRGDANLLDRLFLNLLDNAVKHSPPGGRITVSLQNDAGWHVIDVRDQGPGIPPEAQPLVFDRFFRVDTSRARNVLASPDGSPESRATYNVSPTHSSGAGLGLAIARWIAEAHGGAVTPHKSSPQCACFRVLLLSH